MRAAKPSSGASSLWLGLPVILLQALSLASVREDKVCPPPNYNTFVPPGAGESYRDPVFGTVIKRISDATRTSDVAGGRQQLAFITHEYSTMSPFNKDDSRLLLLHLSYFALYDGDGKFIENLPFEINASSEPRWSRQNPDLLFYVRGNQLKQFDVVTSRASVVHTFAEYRSVRGHGESDICFDGDHFVLAGDGRYVFRYELSTDRQGPVFDTGGREFDSLYITPDENVTITWLQPGTARYQGIELFDHNMNFLRQVTRAAGHMDVTRDLDGQEVLVWVNAADPRPVCKNGVVKVRLSDGQQTCLLSLAWGLAMHVSAPDDAGWAVITTYAPDDPRPGERWKPYTNEILAVSLDGARVWRLGHHRSRPFNGYWWQPRASASHSGRKLIYSSDYDLQSILGYPSEYTDAYLIAGVDTYLTPPRSTIRAGGRDRPGTRARGAGEGAQPSGPPS